MKKLSIVVPCYNEEGNLNEFLTETNKNIKNLSLKVEFVFVDDGSSDGTLVILREMSETNESVHFISFSRNFGKEAAILAGLQYSTGDAVILMDADLQHPPSLIPNLWKYFEEGYDQVIAKRNRTGESFVHRNLTKFYYKFANKLVDVELSDGVGDFRLLSRRALDALLKLNENNRFSKGLFSWIGFHEKIVEYENQARAHGSGKWSLNSLWNYGIDGILSFNNKPLRMAVHIGTIITMVGIIYIGFLLGNFLIRGIDTPGYITTIAAIIILGGMQLLFLGVIGEYIGRIYYETKRRPIYLVKEKSFKE